MPNVVVDQEDAEDEAPVADAVGDERLLAGVRRALLLVPVADQQVRAEAHAFPAHEHHQEVVSQDEHEHEEAEQVQVAEEARDAAARLVGHVGRRVDVDQRADAGDDEDHHPGQRIEPEAPRSPGTGRCRCWSRAGSAESTRRRVTSNARASAGSPSSCQNANSDRPSAADHHRAGDEPGRLARERTDARRRPLMAAPMPGRVELTRYNAYVRGLDRLDGLRGADLPDPPRPPASPAYHRIRFISSMLIVSLLR